MGQRMASDENQHHLEGKAENSKDPRIPGGQNYIERAGGRERRGRERNQCCQSNRENEWIGHKAFEQVDRNRCQTAAPLRRGFGFRAHPHAPWLRIAAISCASNPTAVRISSVCSPIFGAGLRHTPGVAENRGTILGMGTDPSSGSSTSTNTPRAWKCGS